VLAVGLERYVDGCAAEGLEGRVGKVDGEDVGPEGAKGHYEFRAVPVEGAVDGVVVIAGLGTDACGAVIGPGVEVGAGCYADGGVLHAEGGDGVVEIVCVADFRDVGGLVGEWLVWILGIRVLRLTQRSVLPFRLILDPAGMAAPLYVQGPVIDGAL
jgi:hypothetical protein